MTKFQILPDDFFDLLYLADERDLTVELVPVDDAGETHEVYQVSGAEGAIAAFIADTGIDGYWAVAE